MSIVTNVNATTVRAAELLTIPTTQNISDISLQPKGSIVFELSTDILKISDGLDWLNISSTGVMLVAGPGISITGGNVITNTEPSTDIDLNSEPTSPLSFGIVSINSANPLFLTKTLTAGSGVTITDSGTDLTLNATSLQYTAGTGIDISGTTITNTGVLSVTAGASGTIAITGTPQNPTVSGNYIGGVGISVVNNVITNTMPGAVPTPTTLTSLASNSLVVGSVGPNLTIKGLVAGTGITITASSSALSIYNSAPSTDVRLNNAGGVSLVYTTVGPNLETKGLNAGAGITLSDNGTFVDIINALSTYPVLFYNDSPLLGSIGTPAQWELVGFDRLTPDWAPSGYVPDFSATFIGGPYLPPIVSGGTGIYTGFLCNRQGVYSTSYELTVYNSGGASANVGTAIFTTSNNGGTFTQQPGSLFVGTLLPGETKAISKTYEASYPYGVKCILCVFGSSTDVFVGTHGLAEPLPVGPGGAAVSESVATLSWSISQNLLPP